MRNAIVYYSPTKHEGATNMINATYKYDVAITGTFSNWRNGERVAGLTAIDHEGNHKRFRLDNIIRLAGS